MSLIGSISLTNKEGIFLGSVNVDNLNLQPNQIVYSNDGIKLDGLNLGNGLQKDLTTLKTIGNSNIQLTSNSLFVNDNQQTIQSQVNNATQADCIYISSGSYGENVSINNKQNIALIAPQAGNTICEIIGGLSITGTSELIRLVSLQIEGISNSIAGVGRHYLYKCVFQGFSSQTNFITIKDCSNYVVFEGCEFDNFCNITVANSFASVLYFINCNFQGATLNFNQASAQQVILNNCAGFLSLPGNATQIGLNVLANGVSNVQTTNINGSAYSQDFMKNTNTLNQTSSLIPFRTQDDNQNNFTTDTDFSYSDLDKVLNVGNIEGVQFLTVANIGGVSLFNNQIPLAVSNQANNRIITATATNNSLNAEQDLLYDGNILSIGQINLHPTNSSTATINLTNHNNPTGASNSVIIGYQAFGAGASTVIGHNSLRNNTSGTYNSVLGSFTGGNVTNGNGLCLIGGNNSGNMTSCTNNTIIGVSSGVGITTQSNNTICGYFSDVRDNLNNSYANCSVLGANIRGIISGSNQVQLGDSATNTFVYGTVQTRSDSRDKTDIQDTQLGLNFIEKLKPRDFRWDYRESYIETIINPETQEATVFHLDKDGSKKRTRKHHGLIAQEVKAVMDEMGIDFGGYQDHSFKGGADRLTIGYEELIAPLIKAIQELSSRVKQLENK
jgi:hypothetical protein